MENNLIEFEYNIVDTKYLLVTIGPGLEMLFKIEFCGLNRARVKPNYFNCFYSYVTVYLSVLPAENSNIFIVHTEFMSLQGDYKKRKEKLYYGTLETLLDKKWYEETSILYIEDKEEFSINKLTKITLSGINKYIQDFIEKYEERKKLYSKKDELSREFFKYIQTSVSNDSQNGSYGSAKVEWIKETSK